MIKLILLFSISLLVSCSYYFGKNRLPLGANFDKELPVLEYSERLGNRISAEEHSLTAYYSNQILSDWETRGKVSEPRIMIAKLLSGNEIDKVNEYIKSLEPWGRSGTRWILNPRGDYDFTEIPLCVLLYTFRDKPDILYPETQNHIAQNLLIHSGGKPALKTPRTFRVMRETENHILMSETSRYLKNQWMYENVSDDKKYNNIENGLEKWLLNHVNELRKGGFFEFNSLPYSGYSINALLVLHSFAESEDIKIATQNLLDQLVWEYTYSSKNLRRFPPFRRQFSRAELRTFHQDPMSGIMKVWMDAARHTKGVETNHLRHFGLIALLTDYRPPLALVEKALSKDRDYYLAIGRGHNSTPEIYSGGPGYLISGGGTQPWRGTQIISRQTLLFLDDNATVIDSCFYIPGRGKRENWNNTGVYKKFAVGNHEVHIPQHMQALKQSDNWKLFETPTESLYVVTYSKEDLGLIFLIRSKEQDLQRNFESLIARNAQNNLYNTAITFAGDTIEYKLRKSSRREVIRQINGEARNRKLSRFPRIEFIEAENL